MQFLRLFINTEKCKNITFLLQDVVNFFTNVCYNFVQIREVFYEKIIYMFLTAILVIVSLFSAVGCKEEEYVFSCYANSSSPLWNFRSIRLYITIF